MNQKEKYLYDAFSEKYLLNFSGATVSEVPWQNYVKTFNPATDQGYCIGDIAKEFIAQVEAQANSMQEPDLFNQKVELASDKTMLVLAEIEGREYIRNQNLSRLYDDLLRIDNLKLRLNSKDFYLPDKTEIDLLKMENQARDLIRREIKDSTRDLSFVTKELRESLLESKIQNQKAAMLADMSSLEIDISASSPTAYEPWGGSYK